MVALMADTALGTELLELMHEQRLGPSELATLAGVTRRTVYNVQETGRASVETLWKLAVALATHPHTRRRNQLVYADAFARLLRAGGFPEEIAQIIRVDVEDELAARVGDRAKAEALMSYLDDYNTLPTAERDAFDRVVFRKAHLRRNKEK